MGVSTGSQNKACAYEFLSFVARPDIALKYNMVVGGIDPVRKSTLDNPDYQKFIDPQIAAAIKAAHAHAVFWPTSAIWSQMQEPLTDNLSLALTGDKTPQQALDDTQLAWLQLLKK
jgi:multiple sugar transport system substrate-binding protein